MVEPRNILFVSSTTIGGSGRSQRELAKKLQEFGHDVTILADDGRDARFVRWAHKRLANLSARSAERRVHRLIAWLAALPGRTPTPTEVDGIAHQISPVPENAFPCVAAQTNAGVVVGNSLVRLSWRVIRRCAADRGLPSVLYVRETTTYGHLDLMADPADRIVANAETLASGVRTRGFECTAIPSVIDVRETTTESTRKVALLINPAATHGIDMLWLLAERFPDVPFVVQESWPLAPAVVDDLRRRAVEAGNVQVRAHHAAGPELYADARLVLAPHHIDNRPRVVLEAQANGIPVIGSDVPGLAETIGPGGIVVAVDDPDGWAAALREAWDEPLYGRLVAAARRHAARPEVDPELIARRFEGVLDDLLTTTPPDS